MTGDATTVRRAVASRDTVTTLVELNVTVYCYASQALSGAPTVKKVV
jgi:hypothetical protein